MVINFDSFSVGIFNSGVILLRRWELGGGGGGGEGKPRRNGLGFVERTELEGKGKEIANLFDKVSLNETDHNGTFA